MPSQFWEKETDKRLSRLETKMDRILDPEIGIHAKILQLDSRLSRWAILILTGIVTELAVQFILK